MRIAVLRQPGDRPRPAAGPARPGRPRRRPRRRGAGRSRASPGSSRAPGCGTSSAGPPDLPSVFARVPERDGLSGRRLAAATWAHAFGGVIAGALAGALLDLAREWRPDLVVHDDSEQGTWIAAERLGIPHVSLQATAWRGAGVPPVRGAPQPPPEQPRACPLTPRGRDGIATDT